MHRSFSAQALKPGQRGIRLEQERVARIHVRERDRIGIHERIHRPFGKHFRIRSAIELALRNLGIGFAHDILLTMKTGSSR